MPQKSRRMKNSTSNCYQQRGDQPRILSPALDETEENNYFDRKWNMNQVDPRPHLNEDDKSVISSFEHIDHEDKGHWCTDSYTIANRISKLYKGQDDDIFIFSRERSISESEKEEEQKDIKAPNNILLHHFNFKISEFH